MLLFASRFLFCILFTHLLSNSQLSPLLSPPLVLKYKQILSRPFSMVPANYDLSSLLDFSFASITLILLTQTLTLISNTLHTLASPTRTVECILGKKLLRSHYMSTFFVRLLHSNTILSNSLKLFTWMLLFKNCIGNLFFLL